LRRPESGKCFQGIFNHLKHRFIHFTKVAFCDIQKAENELSGLFDHLKNHFNDFTLVVIYDFRRQIMNSQSHSRT
jgi:hypothetical protein